MNSRRMNTKMRRLSKGTLTYRTDKWLDTAVNASVLSHVSLSDGGVGARGTAINSW